jgi:hypothetical protein
MACPTNPCNCCTGACCCGRNTCTSLNCADCTTTSVTSTKGYGDFMGYGVLCSDHLVGSGAAATYYPYCDKPIGYCCNKATGACARDSINGPTISQCECYREKGAPPTIEFAAKPLCSDPTLPCCPYGACCYTSGACANDTKCMCEYLGGTFIDTGVEDICQTGACCQGTTCVVRTKCACSKLSGAVFKGYDSTCTPNPCTSTSCVTNADCPGFIDDTASCCGNACALLGCCVVTFTSTCLSTCTNGCKAITTGPNAGRFQCFTDICLGNPLP